MSCAYYFSQQVHGKFDIFEFSHKRKRPMMCLILFFLKIIHVIFRGKPFLFCHFLTPNLTELNVKLVALKRKILSIDTFDITKNH